MPYYVTDRSTWPVVTIKFMDPATDDEFDAYLDTLDALYEQEEPFALIFDARDAAYLPAKYRRRQAEWMEANHERIEHYLAGTAYVVDSLVTRGVLRAIFAMQSQPAPYTIVGTLEEAHAWTDDQLHKQVA